MGNPEADPENFTTTHPQDTPSPYPWGEQHAAYIAALDNPDRRLIDRLAELRTYELIHERTVEMLGLARREAMQRHGAAWAALIEDQANAPWSA